LFLNITELEKLPAFLIIQKQYILVAYKPTSKKVALSPSDSTPRLALL
jgi:hypothetical protein